MLRQVIAITAMNIEAMRGRFGACLVIVAGMAAVVGVTLSVLSLSSGLASMIAAGAKPYRAVVTSRDARMQSPSSLPRDAVQAIMDSPGIKHDRTGKPIASSDIIAGTSSVKKADGLDGFVYIVGVSSNFFTLHPDVHVIDGRMFKPAIHELIVGNNIRDQFVGFDLGASVPLQDGDWTVVGIYTADGITASNVLGDSETMMSAFRRSAYNSVTAELDPDARGFDTFKAALTTNPTLTVDVDRESDFFAREYESFNTLLTAIAYWVGGVMGLGAVFGALNTMYAAVAARTLEIATLRAIGFGPAPVVVSILVESLLLALAGATIGAAVAWLAFNGERHMMVNMTFNLFISPKMLAGGVVFAMGLGLIGALFPAIRAARLPVATALQVR